MGYSAILTDDSSKWKNLCMLTVDFRCGEVCSIADFLQHITSIHYANYDRETCRSCRENHAEIVKVLLLVRRPEPSEDAYFDKFTKRFCAMRCRSAGKAEMENRMECLSCACEVKLPHQYYFCSLQCFDETTRTTNWRMLSDGLPPSGRSVGSQSRTGAGPNVPRPRSSSRGRLRLRVPEVAQQLAGHA